MPLMGAPKNLNGLTMQGNKILRVHIVVKIQVHISDQNSLFYITQNSMEQFIGHIWEISISILQHNRDWSTSRIDKVPLQMKIWNL